MMSVITAAALCLGGCGISLAKRSPPLRDLDYSSAAVTEPDDEAERQQLPVGCFSGLTLTQHVVGSLDDALADGKIKLPVQIVEVAEHSPADLAGLRPLDVLIAAQVNDQPRQDITHLGLWLQIEQTCSPGAQVTLWFNRLGASNTATLSLTKRARPGKRIPIRALTEDQRIGIAVRTLTEVESRRLQLMPGVGIKIIGMSKNSPWRSAGIQLEEIVTAVDDHPITQPEELIRLVAPETKNKVVVSLLRNNKTELVSCPLTTRETAVTENSFFGLYSYSYAPSSEELAWSGPLWLIGYESTPSAWRMSLLWFIHFGGGERAALKEVQAK